MNLQERKIIGAVLVLLVLVIPVHYYLFHYLFRKYVEKPLVTNFEECAKAGYPIMESYPAQCRTAGGETFVQVVANPSPISPPAPLPTEKNNYGYVSGHVTIGPICPVERVDNLCKVPPEVYTSREAVVYASDGTTVKNRVHLDTQGNYKIALDAGNYFIQIAPAGIGPGAKKPLTIKLNETTVVDFNIDTGIR